jgi:glutathione S-transferase
VQEIVLTQPPTRPWGTPNMSPFCAKLETYLRATELPYKTASRFSRGPKGKVPHVVLDGKAMGDSQLIIDELEKRLAAEGKTPLDHGLSAHDRALARFVRRTFEEAYYFVGLYSRWLTDEGYPHTRDEFKKFIPGLIVPLIRRGQIKKLDAQGTGRHSRDEVFAMGIGDLDALSELLADRPYLLGDQMRTVDCTLYAFLEGTLGFPVDSPQKKAATSHANLVAYRQRIRDRYWKDLPVS